MFPPRASPVDSAVSRILVTGAHGCIGAWVVHQLVQSNREVVTFDLSTEPRRLRLLLGDAADDVPHVAGDIADGAALERALADHAITGMIHLAALQVPFVRADPPLGARVNVLGTVNVFEAAKRQQLGPVVYASSVAALDRNGSTVAAPSTLYGVFKRANEQTARVYFEESGVPSVGLRPHTVYGVGRDQGLTSAPTTAMLAAAAGVTFTIPYGGACQMQLAADVARAFIAATDARAEGATVHNLPGRRTAIHELVSAIGLETIDFDDISLPFPEETDVSSFYELLPDFAETPLNQGVQATIESFRRLLTEGRLAAPIVEPKGLP
jgi:nucleoside-diphosphate-sugar epimerase